MHPGHDVLGPLLLEYTAAAFLVAPVPVIITKISPDGPVIHRFEILYIFFPLYDQSQGWGLYPPRGKLGIELAGEGPGNVKTDQPVGLGPAHRRIIEGIIIPAGF